MNARRFMQGVGKALPYMGGLAVALLTALLVATIWLAPAELHWVAFLAGVLIAASLSVASRASTSAWTAARRSSQLKSTREKLATESLLRERAEHLVAGVNRTVHYVDELFPAMFSYVDGERRVQFHNRAYSEWLGEGTRRLEGRELPQLLGGAWPEVSTRLDEAFAGRVVRYERTQTMHDGLPCRVAALYLPRFGAEGKVAGVFCVLADITGRESLAAAEDHAAYSSVIAGELTEWRDVAERLACAIEGDEFELYFQEIVPAAPGVARASFREILLRLREEEDNLMPPGAFLPLAAQHNLLPDLDMWVVRHLLHWASATRERCAGVYSVNVSAASMADAVFVDGVRKLLRARAGEGPALCFEFSEAEAGVDPQATRDFMGALRAEGCKFALAGFGRPPVSFALPRELGFDYIKIDAGVVLAAVRDPVEVARVKAITRVARSLGARTIAECVETEAARKVMADAGVDHVQGFAISRPAPLQGMPAALAA